MKTPPVTRWTDRHGQVHQEREAPHVDEPRMERVLGPLERAWERADDRERLVQEVSAQPNPIITPDPDDPSSAVWTWVVEATDARAVLLWINAVFDHDELDRAELKRLPDSDLWSASLRLPTALRTVYRIAVWRAESEPPWRMSADRREVVHAAVDVGAADPRCPITIRAGRGDLSSIGVGPDAEPELWRSPAPVGPASALDELALPGDERAWLYTPAPLGDSGHRTPLLVLFDGQMWRDMGLQDVLDDVIARGMIPPIHVALLDSGPPEHRVSTLGVPGAQVDVVLDHLLPAVRASWDVDPSGAATIVAGQSLGGLAALWTLALSDGEVTHAIAQSPSLWRFDLADVLLTAPRWHTIELQAGTFESDMLDDAEALAAALGESPLIDGRSVRLHHFVAGHDWAAWRTGLIAALARHRW